MGLETVSDLVVLVVAPDEDVAAVGRAVSVRDGVVLPSEGTEASALCN